MIPAGQPKVRNNDCDYMFRPDTTFAYYTGLGSDYEAGAVLVLNPVDPDSPEAAAGKTHCRNCSWLRARTIPRRTFSWMPTTENTGLARVLACRR